MTDRDPTRAGDDPREARAVDPGDSRNSIVLVGPRAAGKTTLARELASHLGYRCVDADDLLAAKVAHPAGEYLATAGELAFRAVEEEVSLAALEEAPAADQGRVLALGGGAVLSGKIRVALARPAHFVVFLFAPVAVLAERQSAGAARPPLTDLPLSEEVHRVFAARKPLYESVSDLALNTFSTDVPACLQSILATMGRGGE